MARIDLEPLPHREAIEYFRSKGYAHELQRFHHLDHFREDHARNWVVAKAMQDDVARAIREAFETALTEGQPLAAFQEGLAPRLQQLGWWGRAEMEDPVTGETEEVQLGSMRRLRVIFDTNMRTAHAAGHWAAIQRTKTAFPYLHYIQIQRPTKRHGVLIGDSIAWGLTVIGGGTTTPRDHALSDVRNNITSPSFANLFRRWLARTGRGGANENEHTPGGSEYSREVLISPYDDPSIRKINSAGRIIPMGGVTSASAALRRTLDIAAGDQLIVPFMGNAIDVIHADLVGSGAQFYVDDQLVATYPGSAGGSNWGRVTAISDLSAGRHVLRIVSNGSSAGFRLEALRRVKRVSLINNGIIGTRSGSWLPSGSLLPGGIPAGTTHVLIQLGTNDRGFAGSATEPAGAASTYPNLVAIVDWVRANRPDAACILLAPPVAPTDGSEAGSGDVLRAVRRAAEARGCGYIDIHSVTGVIEDAGGAWLDDGLHPNDAGHRAIAENIVSRLSAARGTHRRRQFSYLRDRV